MFVLYKNGLFDFKTKELEVKRSNLEWDIKTFEARKDSLIIENKKLENSATSLFNQGIQYQVALRMEDSTLNSRDRLFRKIFLENNTLREIHFRDSMRIALVENKSLSFIPSQNQNKFGQFENSIGLENALSSLKIDWSKYGNDSLKVPAYQSPLVSPNFVLFPAKSVDTSTFLSRIRSDKNN